MKQYKGLIPEVSIKYKTGTLHKAHLKSSEDSWKYFLKIFDADTIEYNESFFMLYLNRRNTTLAWFKVSQGGMTGTIADPKMIIKTALDVGAHSIILGHNHPSQETRPSEQDIKLTKQIKNACQLFDIVLLDHIIVCTNSYLSFADEGLI